LQGRKPAKETSHYLKLLKPAQVPLMKCEKSLPEKWHTIIEQADLIIDALLGTGLKGAPKEPIMSIIKLINQSSALVLAADTPSGFHADTESYSDTTINADFTLTFGLPKSELFNSRAANQVGQLSVDTLSFPKDLISADQQELQYMDAVSAARLLPKRPVNVHKKNTGKVVIIGGSGAYHGAVLLAARGALRMGSGHVTQAYPIQLNTIIREHALETLCVPLPCNKRCSISKHALKTMIALTEDKDAVVLGPGMGWESTTQQLIRSYITQVKGPQAMVIDADALHAIAEDPGLFTASLGSHTILIPHEGEAAILLGRSSKEIHHQRIEVAKELCRQYQSIVVLKGQHSIVTAPNKPCYIIGSGTQALAVAGTGDVLSGMIGSLVAQKMEPFDAALLGTFIHGIAGTLISPDPFGLGARAGEIADAVPQAIASLRHHPKCYINAELANEKKVMKKSK